MARKKSGRARHIAATAIEEGREILRAMIDGPPPVSFRELVAQLFDEIQRFRANGQSWQEIQQRVNARIPIGLRTLQLYYHDESVRRAAK